MKGKFCVHYIWNDPFATWSQLAWFFFDLSYILWYIKHKLTAITESDKTVCNVLTARSKSEQEILTGPHWDNCIFVLSCHLCKGAFCMLKIAIYGKGGIGKSTVTSNLAAAFAALGKRVIQIGCDPKADSTINLLGGEPLLPVMNYMREQDEDPEELSQISRVGFGGVLCIETGGPTPGLGCAGRGIIATFQLLEDLRLFETWQPDVVLYDVLGDVVCGGFAAPIREGYAEKVLIVTSGEKMALYAANNINSAVKNFEDRSYARVEGVVLNHRNVDREHEKVRDFADRNGLEIVAEIPRSDDIIRFEDQGMTVIQGDPELEVSHRFFALAQRLLDSEESV